MCLTAYTCIKRTALSTESTPFGGKRSYILAFLYFNSSKTRNTEFEYHDTDDVAQVMADTEAYAETGTRYNKRR